MVTSLHSRPVHPRGSTLRTPFWLARQLVSFEAFFLLFLYGVQIRQILPPIPGNEAYVFGAITIVMGGWIIIRDGLYLRGVPILITGLAFTGWMILSIGWTPSRIIVWENVRFLLTVNLWALFAGTCIIAGSRQRVIRLLIMTMLLALVLALYGIYIEIIHGSFRFYSYKTTDEEWVTNTYIAWGYIVSTGAAMAFALTIFSRFGSLKQLAALAVFGVCSYFLLINGARGPLLGIATAILLATVVQLPRISGNRIEFAQTQLLALAIVILGLAYVGYLFATGQSTYTINRFITLFDQADDALLRTGANRFDQFAGAYRLWLDAPAFGNGLAGFYYLYGFGREIPGNHPHNIILQILAEFGLVGLLLFALFIVSGLRNFGFGRLQNDPLALAVLMVFATMFLYAMVAGDIARSYRFFFTVALLAMCPPAEEDDELNEENTTAAR